jgi:uncharacterized protein
VAQSQLHLRHVKSLTRELYPACPICKTPTMLFHQPDNTLFSSDPIADILRQTKTIAVVGLSSNPTRPSNVVGKYLQSVGYRIIPVNPNESEVLGQKSYASFEELTEPIDLVDVFRRSEEIPPIVASAIKIRAKFLWFQLGITNPTAAEEARVAGIPTIEDACLFIEHKKRRPPLGA